MIKLVCDSFQRPPWSTGILIPASFLCGIIAAIFIWRGGQKTKRTKEVEERLRLALAMDQDNTNGYDESLLSPDGHEYQGSNRLHDGYGARVDNTSAPEEKPIAADASGDSPSREKDGASLHETAIDEQMTVPSKGR